MKFAHKISRRRFGLIAGAAALAAPFADARAQAPLLRFATEGANPPWNFVTPQGAVEGIDIDIANALAAKMGMRCEVIATAWDGIIPGLLAKRYDAIIAGMAMTPARRERVEFSDVYRKIITSFVAKKGTVTDISPQALKGKRIGVQRGASQHGWLTRNGYEQTATVVLYDTVAGPQLDLIAGRVDLIIENKISNYLVFMQKPEAAGFEFVGPELTGNELGEGAGIALRKEDNELRARINKALGELRADGTLDRIYATKIPFKML
jgi:lysine-arginine-ornithine-binding protein